MLSTFFKQIPQSSLVWPLLQHAIAKPHCHENPPLPFYLFILISDSYWSWSHLSLPPACHCDGGLHFAQPISSRYFQSLQPTSPFMQQRWQLLCSVSDPVRRKQGEGSYGQRCPVMSWPSHLLPLTHWPTQSNFQSCLSFHSKCSKQVPHLQSFIVHSYCTFSMFRYV